MTVTAARYANWKAPTEDGQILVWPPPADLLRETLENTHSLGTLDSVLVQGIPVSQLRRNIRGWLGHTDNDQPLIATGHQTELYHPGVWAKDAGINAIAERCGGGGETHFISLSIPTSLSISISDGPGLPSPLPMIPP